MSFHNHDNDEYNKKYAKPTTGNMSIDDQLKRVRRIQVYQMAKHLPMEEFILEFDKEFTLIKK